MIPFKLDFVIEKVLENQSFDAQKTLKELTGKNLPKEEAEMVWSRVLDHKWHVSENLRRDVGLRVAAIDYVENFYKPVFPGDKNFGGKINYSAPRRAMILS